MLSSSESVSEPFDELFSHQEVRNVQNLFQKLAWTRDLFESQLFHDVRTGILDLGQLLPSQIVLPLKCVLSARDEKRGFG